MTDPSANRTESLWSFLAGRRPAPTDAAEQAAARRTLRTWMPLLVALMLVTAEATAAGLVARAVVILALLAEWLRVAWPVPRLDPRWVLGLWLVLLGFSLGHGLWRIHPWATPAVALYALVVVAGGLRAWRAAASRPAGA